MQPATAVETRFSPAQPGHSTFVLLVATASLIWYWTVVTVCTIGYVQLWRYYSSPPSTSELEQSPEVLPVTIIRPVKGLEPSMYDCLASTFRQVYQKDRLHIRFCVSDRSDAGYPVLERLLRDFSDFDAQILVESEDDLLGQECLALGPNPKIRNMSRAYREASSDIIWIIDCNVWVPKYTLPRMVARLERDPSKNVKNKFVHQLPLVVDTVGTTESEETTGLLDQNNSNTLDGTRLHDDHRTLWNIGGGRLEELFMSSAHAKFYTAINTVLVAPCSVGKSTMFRRSHLNSLTGNQGIDFFSQNICEDHLIGDLLWKQQVPEERQGFKIGKHALCFGDLAIQPMSNMSMVEYWDRRVRWLRVRKFTVTLATFVEPGTESFLCSAYGAFAFTTLPFFNATFGTPYTWTGFCMFWLISVLLWCATDWTLYKKLQSAASIHVDQYTPAFARPPRSRGRRPLHEWLLAWLGRESLALPIWLWAFWGGTKVEWRGKKFWVGMDMRVHEIEEGEKLHHPNGTILETSRKSRSD